MKEQKIFNSENIVREDKKHRANILDELNLPIKVTLFLREHGKKLLIAGICLFMLIPGWILYDYFSSTRQYNSAALLTEAMQQASDESKKIILQELLVEYSTTDAAVWGQLELGHLAFRLGSYQEAVTRYESVLKDISTGNPIIPLVWYSLAKAYESSGDMENALKAYQTLGQITGFQMQGDVGSKRVLK